MNQGTRSQSMQSRALRKAAAFLLWKTVLHLSCRPEHEHLEWDDTENPELDELESEHSGSPLAYEVALRFSEPFDFIFTRKHQTPVTTRLRTPRGQLSFFISRIRESQLCRSWIRTIRTIRSRTIQMAVFLEKSSFSRKLRRI